MSGKEEQIVHVSDTALMVAACRAVETARADGLVRDPFAERLAGERGMAIARALPGFEVLCFGIGIRIRFLDELVAHALRTERIETVVSVGSGLDTRPWRLDLPPDLRWIEVDFPAMLNYKAGIMASERPKCHLDHVSADLNDEAQRQAVFASAGSAPGLMITEGLLMYLPAATVEALATEAIQMSGIRYWLLDLTSPELERRVRMDSFESIQRVRDSNHMNGEQLLDAVQRNGWTSIRHRSYTRDVMEIAADRVRAYAHRRAASEQTAPTPPHDPSGAYLFARV